MKIANMTDNNTDSVLTPEKFEVHRGYDYEKILFGLFFVFLAFRYRKQLFFINILFSKSLEHFSWLIIKPVKRRKDSKHELSDGDSSLTRFLQSLPCAGISKLILTGVSIILTVLVTSAEDQMPDSEASIDRLAFVTIYLSFALTGIVDILSFYSYPR